ncbi:conserved hypothetical protein [Actinacidiphila cocklensis]|uniref:Uncharacterized protein n=2 Tax=Actinacidiphila cocklensis TaxID=887465 RepID=A0A9W4E113_9ACTN|nr:conserved hypothetical protein [Actinacidiphila cocklensis]
MLVTARTGGRATAWTEGSRVSGIDECLLRAMTLPGARGAALVEWVSGLALGVIGEAAGGDHEAVAAETAAYARATAEHPVFTADQHGPGPAAEEAVVVTGTGYHLLRFVEAPYEGGVFLYLWLDRPQANLALALRGLRELAEGLVLV